MRSIGAAQVDGLVATVTLPAGVIANASSIAGGAACTPGAGSTLACSIGSLAPQASRSITLNLTGTQAGSPVLRVALTASNDGTASNNSAQATLPIDPAADLAVTLAAAPSSITIGGSAQLTATVQHLAGDAVSDARLAFELPADVTVSALATNSLGCTLQGGAVSCTATALAAGASQAVTLTLSPTVVGSRNLRATVSTTTGDPASANNAAQATLDTAAAPTAGGGGASGGGTAASGSSGGGGGGALDLGWLSILLAWRLRRVALTT